MPRKKNKRRAHNEKKRAESPSTSSDQSRAFEERVRIGSTSGEKASTSETVARPTTSDDRSMEKLISPLRPKSGTAGKTCTVVANHFYTSAEQKNVFQYEIKFINPEVKSKTLGRTLMKKFIEQYDATSDSSRRLMTAYDGRNIFYVASPLSFESRDFELALINGVRNRPRIFQVSIKLTRTHDVEHLNKSFYDNQTKVPYDTLAALDVVMRETPSNEFVTISRSFFSDDSFKKGYIGKGLECWKGYFQSLRPTQMGLSLNLDISATSFYKSLTLTDFVVEFLGLRSVPRVLANKNRLEIENALKGVLVETPNNKIRYKITGITSQSANDLMFVRDGGDGREISVAEYFRSKRNNKLQYGSLPCIKAGSDNKPKYLPMEVCQIVRAQRCIKKLNNQQVREMLKLACTNPTQRKNEILQLAKKNYTDDAYAKEFGIAVQTDFTTVQARQLPAPRLKYGNDTVTPAFGKWNISEKRLYRGATVTKWACISYIYNNNQNVEDFCRRLASKCNQFGMKFNEHAQCIRHCWKEDIVKTLEAAEREFKGLQLLIIILPDNKEKSSYGMIKTICETELGLVTQCCRQQSIMDINPKRLDNLVLKINVKTGGCNAVLEACVSKQIPLLKVPTIIFGADVTHPAAGEDSPSIAAVVASMDWPEVTKYRCLLSAQNQRQELIEDLYKITGNNQKSGMIWELLKAFHEATGHIPKRIIFYRDGVSEGQFNQVLDSEVNAIKEACKSIDPTNPPRITFVVVQKRHHTRLFPEQNENENSKKGTEHGNVKPGTVVDTKICHPSDYDFYLCSHAGIKGTSRPAHYHVLYDENNYSSDELQQLTYNLCYTYCRCTSSVSIVPPAYYAHLAAARARHYMETMKARSSQAMRETGQPIVTVPTLPALKDNVKQVMFYC